MIAKLFVIFSTGPAANYFCSDILNQADQSEEISGPVHAQWETESRKKDQIDYAGFCLYSGWTIRRYSHWSLAF
jgi:hypothetical protein